MTASGALADRLVKAPNSGPSAFMRSHMQYSRARRRNLRRAKLPSRRVRRPDFRRL